MRFAQFFIARPVFAAVISIAILIIGAIAGTRLPISEYPEIAPPTITIAAQYPGASASVIAETVASPIEQEINGVERMLYVSSQATGDGKLTINVVFEQGTDIDQAQVLVQNRVAIAEPRLPPEVRTLGLIVKKASPDIMMVIHLVSPDKSRSDQYLANYATLNIKDRLARLDGVGDVQLFGGGGDYAMRVWLDPARIAARGLTPGEVLAALRRANVQVAAGGLNHAPTSNASGEAFQINISALGRLRSVEEFGEIVVAANEDGAALRLKDVARVELGSQDYTLRAYLTGESAVAMPVFQRPGSNALATAGLLHQTLEQAKRDFPPGVDYRIVYDTTQFIEQSMEAVLHTFVEAIILVVLVVILFLQSWRASIIPLVAIPISIIGTFAFMGALGISLNSLSMFGLILAIGIVVDDAIVVVENVERHLANGLDPLTATRRTMDEVGFALIAIALVLCAVFVPTAFIEGLAGAFYQQFAVTIAVATLLSALVSLTLSPALAALLLRPHSHHKASGWRAVVAAPFGLFFRGFNKVFDALSLGYGALTRRLVRMSAIVMILFGGLLLLTGQTIRTTPVGLIPPLDRGYLIAAFQLPPGATLGRTDAVMRAASEQVMQVPGVANTVMFTGFDGATFTNAPNTGVIFVTLDSFEKRAAAGIAYPELIGAVQAAVATQREAMGLVIPPPSVSGIGTGGGFKLYVQDRGDRGARALEAVTNRIVAAASQRPEIAMAFTLFNTATPTLRAEVDRSKAEMLGVPLDRVSEALSVYLGSAYVNDFNILGRTYRVTAQAEEAQRRDARDVSLLRTRNDAGDMVPIGSVATLEPDTGPYRVPRYNLFPAAEVQGAAAPGVSTGQAIAAMQEILARELPPGYSFEWTEIALQETTQGNTAPVAFGLAVVFVFLLLAALYESWLLPLAVVLIAPMSVLAALSGVLWRGLDNNVLVQIGLVVLIGLAAKNAILIVEFARHAEQEGMSRWQAAEAAARTRLRPILMTSLAFILGVLPLAIATGAGAEMRQSLGTAVFAGMLGVTIFGLLFTPVFYVVARAMARRDRPAVVQPAE
ncbi:efflux RND transporter permease subunit [Teichococcus oryzae]|uniref:Efflux pump membrane transporter n=1 Tax=Teichococcus oryzae TaxID=1608942 RepID=A0A5B2TLM3_9PROT|nr:multidrug efflux RND transporter permease subunit [Pseudoroseomonas oryzae]KAA2214838.1 multidrug efflux RND transporter permease subunit [Pseudoroseomonas oryzae]